MIEPDAHQDLEAVATARLLLVRLDALHLPGPACPGWHSAAADGYALAVRRLGSAVQEVREALTAVAAGS